MLKMLNLLNQLLYNLLMTKKHSFIKYVILEFNDISLESFLSNYFAMIPEITLLYHIYKE